MAFYPGDGETLEGIRQALEKQNTLLHRQNTLLSIVAREMICVNHEIDPELRTAAKESIEIGMALRGHA